MYKRVLLKLSGESLAGEKGVGINENVLQSYAKQIKSVVSAGIQVGIVIGGGNIFRGLKGVGKGFDRVRGDQMGMLATIINSLGLQSALINEGQPAVVLTSINMAPVGEIYSKHKAVEMLSQGKVVIIAGGTGNPFFTTDTASALRGVEIEAEILLKGTRVDGVYTADPEKDPNAVKFHEISFAEVMEKRLKVMDLTAFAMCMENNLPIMVFNMDVEGNLYKLLVEGNLIGTIVK